jgi:hypothetical protein
MRDAAPTPESTLAQEAAMYALSHWTVEARAKGAHEDDVRVTFEKALDWARDEYGD